MFDYSRYETGYKKPPPSTRFKKGASGNPRGRPKGSKSLKAIVQQISRQRVTITANGRHRSVSKVEAGMLQLANKAASGDLRAIWDYTKLLAYFEQSEPTLIQPPDLHVHFVGAKEDDNGTRDSEKG